MSQLRSSAVDVNLHEQVFVRRYERLRSWALHLTNQDRAQAEDLLHDAFIQFLLTRPDLGAIQHLDAYLCGVLRMLWLSQLRQAARRPTAQLSIIEYDSAELGLRLTDPRDALKARDELRAICRYACLRKESLKTGGVLILRFFHGYYPSEIARVLRSSRNVVDTRLAAARSEAKLYLDAPERLSFIKPAPAQEGVPVMTKTDDLLQELRHTVFRSRQGVCPSAQEWREIYQEEAVTALSNAQLSHAVSCPACLEQINQLLDLPPLAERFPTDTLRPEANTSDPGDDDPQSGASGTTGGGAADLQQRAQRRLREVFEHRPQELRIAVNGVPRGAQKIHAALNEQTLEINQTEPISFVEVFSEQGLRLLFLPVAESNNNNAPQAARVDLSDDRWLELTLRCHESQATLNVGYGDPLLAAENTALAEDETEFALLPPPANAATIAARLRRLIARLRPAKSERDEWPSLFAPRSVLRPGLAVALALVVIGLAFWRWLPTAPAVSAAELLRKSIAAEAQLSAATDQATRRTINLEERDATTGQLRARHRIEVWQKGKLTKARRLYDSRDQLLAGEWQQAGGRRLAYRPPSSRVQSEAARAPVWRVELAAQEFAALVGAAAATLVEQPDSYLLNYEMPPEGTPTAIGRLMKAALRISKADLRAIEQRLLAQVDAAAARATQRAPQLIEYRFIESAFERRPADGVPPAVFQVDAELQSAVAAPTSLIAPPAEGKQSVTAPSSEVTSGAAQLSERELAELEIEARYLLDQVNANLGEQVSITRLPKPGVRVRALVETDERKAQLLAALAPLRPRPGVSLEVVTYAEAQRRSNAAPGTPTVFTEAEAGQRQLPVAPELRRYFTAQAARQPQLTGGRAPAVWIEEQIARFAGQMQSQAARPLRHAWALKNLFRQIPPAEARSLSPAAQDKWRAMARAHALAIQRETAELRRQLQPIFFPQAPDEAGEVSNEDDLAAIAERLVELTSLHDNRISKAFSQSTGAASAIELDQQLGRSLRAVERLAAALARAGER